MESNVGGMFTWSYWKSVFNRRPDYNVIVHQKDPIKDKTYTFVVHETDNLEVANAAFKSICETLEPLVDDCAVILTTHLLVGIISPTPRKAEELSEVITELMQVNPDAHPDWVTVLRALWRQALVLDSADGISRLVEIGGGNAHCQDNEGNTLLHHAIVAGSAKGVQSITENMSETDKQKILNATNEEGKAAVHCAFEQNDPDIVRALVQSGADLTMAANDADGSNPFHLAAQNDSAKCIQAVHHRGNDFQKISAAEQQKIQKALDAPNKTGFTPLMFTVKGGFVDSTMSLLQADANPNVQHAESGNTALHFAAEKGDAVVLKALIVFGGDIFIRNKEGKTPLDVALKATTGDPKGCATILQEITDLTKEAKDIYASAQKLPDIASDSVFLLCLDGGGVRGLLSLQILMAIRNRMKQIQPDCASSLHEYFDYIAGTSIGGLITLASSALNASLEECRADLFKVVDDVFTTKPTFTFTAADGISKGTFGMEMNISDIKKPRVIIHTVEANVNPPVLHKICNFGVKKSNWKVWEAARATTAAPIYFPPHSEHYIDGGVMANNPTLSAMAEVVEAATSEGKQVKFGVVVSIGTGHGKPLPVNHIGVYVPTISNLLSIPHTLSALGSVLNLFIDQSTSSDGEIVAQARSWCTSVGAQYFRLSPLLSVPIDLAECKKKPIVEMLYEGLIFGLKNARDVDMIARILLTKQPTK